LSPDNTILSDGRIFSTFTFSAPLFPQVAALADGSLILAFDSAEGGKDNVAFYHCDSNGNPVGFGSNFAARSGKTIGSPALKALPGGGFAFAFMEGGASGKDVYAGMEQSSSTFFLNADTIG